MPDHSFLLFAKKIPPIHPGEILLEEFLNPLSISQYRISKEIHVPARRVNEIVHGKRSITADTALRLAKYFGNSAQFWMNLQTRFDLEIQNDEIRHELNKNIKPFKQAA